MSAPESALCSDGETRKCRHVRWSKKQGLTVAAVRVGKQDVAGSVHYVQNVAIFRHFLYTKNAALLPEWPKKTAQ